MVSATETEMDEMWSFVHDKKQQYWFWWAIDHRTGVPFAFCFGTRKYCNLDKLLELLKQFNISQFYSDDHGAYHEKIDPKKLNTVKRNMQQIERKHISLRTWCSQLVQKEL